MAQDADRFLDKASKLRVFISYSRDDLDFADQLFAALGLAGFDPAIDRHGISGGEEWRLRLGGLIREADTVVFVLSPSSAGSDMCAWEVEEAARLGKRILPVVCRPLGETTPPPRLASLNYILFHADDKSPGAGFGTGLVKLAAALNTDLDWLREHTRLLARATEWEAAKRVENRMLSGADIGAAKAWAARRPKGAPEPTALHLDYIRASEAAEGARLDAERQQLAEIAAAQDARAKALAGAEAAQRERAAALEQAALEQKARARAQRIIAWGSAAAALVLAVVAGLAGIQWRRAESQTQQATNILGSATNLVWEMVEAKKIDAKNFDHVTQVFERGAEFGDTDSMFGLGLLYNIGQGVAQDSAKAREWFEKAAAKDSARAMITLGLLYYDGQGMAQDYAKAREWFEKAAARDLAEAMVNLGLLYYNGQGVAQDSAKAREWLEKAAAKDLAEAMTNLGVLYRDGQGVAQDSAKAREWFEKAAAKDSARAMITLGLLYYDGQGMAQDYAKAREWFEKAAAKDNADAMARLGMLYGGGQGVTQDSAKAREWFEKAAAKDNADAMANLGALYTSEGEARDYAKAREWWEKAAAKDNANAMAGLGLLYEGGLGVAQDAAKAREWFEKAAAKGVETAKAALDRLALNEAEADGRYGDALRLQEALAAKIEDAEAKRDGKPGKETARELQGLSWNALLAREFGKALAAGDRALPLDPDIALSVESNRAHALMFLGRADEARALYMAHKDKKMSGGEDTPWEAVIAEDFAALRKAGLDNPMMAEIESALGVLPPQ